MDKLVTIRPSVTEVKITIDKPAGVKTAEELLMAGNEARIEAQAKLGEALWPYVKVEQLNRSKCSVTVSILGG